MAHGFAGSSLFAKLVFIGLIVGIILFLIGFPTDYWLDTPLAHTGIWGFRGTDWIRAVRALCLIGLFCALGALILLILTMFFHSCENNKTMILIALLSALVGGISVLIAITIYGVKMNAADYLGWSFGLTTASGIIFLICAALLVAERK